MTPWIARIEAQLEPLQQEIANHPLIGCLTTLPAVQGFMEHHVFAVWDFVCLLKTLYARIGCVTVPWLPPQNAQSVHFLLRILIDEESDQLPNRTEPLCHFDLYREAMTESGANTQPIQQFLSHLQHGHSLEQALQNPQIPKPAQAFVCSTWAFFEQPTPALAAAFVFGREAMVPQLFVPLLQHIRNHQIPRCNTFSDYLTRHIAIDSQDHYPQALQMLSVLCGSSDQRWESVQQAAKQALTHRLEFLNGIQKALT